MSKKHCVKRQFCENLRFLFGGEYQIHTNSYIFTGKKKMWKYLEEMYLILIREKNERKNYQIQSSNVYY